MSRTDYVTLGIVAVCIVALAFLIYKMVNLDKEPKPEEDQLEQYLQADTLATQEAYIPEEQDTIEYEPEARIIDEEVQDEEEISSIDDYPESGPKASSGDYLVIAGSFRQRMNAELQAARLRKMGFNQARMELFNRGAFAVVLVDRFSNLAEAQTLVNTLAAKGVEARIQKKRG
jgi:cell division protein FtsN